jgi:acyl-CoA synthetase (NDP forming)/GNAT superfamily N-acetyltransferase
VDNDHDDVLLRDGTMARLRPATPDDEQALLALMQRLSVHTLYLRFFSASPRPSTWYVEQVVAQSRTHSALVAERLGEVVAVASWTRMEADPDVGDVALLVDDEHQALGLGSLLLEHLARLAWTQGLRSLHADVLAENSAMIHLFRHSGLPVTVTSHHDVLTVDLLVAPSPALSDAVLAREAVAERASLRPLLAPTSIAVLGSSREGSVGERVVEVLQGSGYTGVLHHVGGDQSVTDLAQPPELAVLAVPAEHVVAAARDCGLAGVRALVVLSAGFAEVGAEGLAMQTELVSIARETDMRLVGPNCLGVVNTDPTVRMNATFCAASPTPGGVALVSQSGAIGLAALRHAEWSGTGLSLFVSTGNKADVSGNDLLLALHDDPRTRVIALYLESFGNAEKFAQVAGWVGRVKPVVVLKSGRTAAGARAGASHTAAAATPDAAVDALLRKAHALRADSVPELFDLVALLDGAPLPRGPRVAVVGNSGGPGVLAADALAAAGLQVPTLSDATVAALTALLPPAASTGNPVDMLATATPEQFAQAVDLAMHDPDVDAVLAIYTPLSFAEAEPFADVLAGAAAKADKLLLACFPGMASPPKGVRDADGRAVLPTYAYPEQAAAALAKVVHWALLPPADEPTAVRVLPPTGLHDGWADPSQTDAVLRSAGLPGVPGVLARTEDEVRAAAADGPVAVKAWGPTLVHKSDVGGVRLHLAGPDEAAAAYREMTARLADEMQAALVQPMADVTGHELVVGLVREPTAGPLVHVGAGGVLTDVLDDHAFLVPPVTHAEARTAVLGLRCAPYLQGGRGRPALDVDAVAEVLVALSDIARGLPEVAELEVNPLLATEHGALALDARMRIEHGVPTMPMPSRALRQA